MKSKWRCSSSRMFMCVLRTRTDKHAPLSQTNFLSGVRVRFIDSTWKLSAGRSPGLNEKGNIYGWDVFRNTNFEERKNLFDVTQRLTSEHEAEILNVSTIDWKVSSLTRCTLMHDQVMKCAKAKVHVCTDSVCKILQKQIEDGKVKWKNRSSSSGTFSQDLRHWKSYRNPKESARSEQFEPEHFEERIIFHDKVLMISIGLCVSGLYVRRGRCDRLCHCCRLCGTAGSYDVRQICDFSRVCI